MLNEIRTDADLLRRLKEAARRPVTAEELQRQRVSFVFGNMDEKSSMTRGDVERVLDRADGKVAA